MCDCVMYAHNGDNLTNSSALLKPNDLFRDSETIIYSYPYHFKIFLLCDSLSRLFSKVALVY